MTWCGTAPISRPTGGRRALIDRRPPQDHGLCARQVAGEGSDREKALRLYYAVRDGLRYDPYNTPMKREAYLRQHDAGGRAWILREQGGADGGGAAAPSVSPARVGYADVRNHMTTKRLSDLMGCDTFYYHGYTEVWLDGRWIKATPAFNKELTERLRLKPLDWDAASDLIYHPFDLGGRRHMEYLAYRGVFADIPFDEIRVGLSSLLSPHDARAGGDGVALGGDFGAEGAAEAAKK